MVKTGGLRPSTGLQQLISELMHCPQKRILSCSESWLRRIHKLPEKGNRICDLASIRCARNDLQTNLCGSNIWCMSSCSGNMGAKSSKPIQPKTGSIERCPVCHEGFSSHDDEESPLVPSLCQHRVCSKCLRKKNFRSHPLTGLCFDHVSPLTAVQV